MQKAMAAEREAEREAQAKVVAANGELSASRNLREASDVIVANPVALQLRYLQTLNTISYENNHTIVLPFPMDLIKSFWNAPPSNTAPRDNGDAKPTSTEADALSRLIQVANMRNQTRLDDNDV